MPKNTKPQKRVVKAFCIVSDEGLMMDANGKSLAIAVYTNPQAISAERKAMFIEGDKIIPCTITYTLNIKK